MWWTLLGVLAFVIGLGFAVFWAGLRAIKRLLNGRR